MENISKKTKILSIIIAIIIIVGAIITFTTGLKFELKYQNAKRLELYIQKEFEISDIKQITDEVLSNQEVLIQKVEVYEDSVSIIAQEITDEQKENIINKINEKYGTEIKAENIQIENIPHTKGRDIIKPYITPFAIATLIVLVYMGIRYFKLGLIKTILKTVIALVLAQATLLSVMAIIRRPIGILTIPMVLTVYLATLIGITLKLEKDLKEKNEEENKEIQE